MQVAQLQVFSSYSLLESTNRIPQLVKRAKELGYTSLALTDHNVLYGALEFYQTCLQEGIKPILGLTLDYNSNGDITKTWQLVIIASNNDGYRNLLALSTAHMEHSAQQPFELKDYQQLFSDLVVITPGQQGELESYISSDLLDRAVNKWNEWQLLFEKSSLYIGINLNEYNPPLKEKLHDFCDSNNAKPIVVQGVRYLNPSDTYAVQILQHIKNGTRLYNEEMHEGQFFLHSPEDIISDYDSSGWDEAIKNANNVANECNVTIELHQKLLPHFPVPTNKSAGDYLRELCEGKLPKRIKQVTETYTNRLNMELDVIHTMGFDDYFLIIWDVVAHARSQNIVIGPGRGSAAGSLVSYILEITDVDPIEFDLLFERFLNVERYTMPDIDLDLPDNRREEVLQYVNQKYGFHHVAQIATFGTMAAKMALRDVARVFGLSQSEANKWSNAVPSTLKITLYEAYESSLRLRQLASESEQSAQLFAIAKQLEGLPRHVSTHAAGVVISDQPIENFVPMQTGTNGIPLTQFAMGDVEALGLLKMDFLGLRNLSIIDRAVQLIYRQTGKKLDVSTIPLDDEKTLRLFQQANTSGVFQFESSGIRNVLRKLGPTSIEDIAAVNALYRPGPMQNIDLFIERKKGIVPVEYVDESLKPILEKTYGIMVYQEQVMQVASVMAGFSLGQADILRRAMSKKKKDVLDKEREHFISGALLQGYTKEKAETVYNYIEKFANYGFNRSHAVAYSFIAYQMAYIKVYFPTEFFAAVLHSVRQQSSKLKEYMSDAIRMHVVLNGPDINKSGYSFDVSDNEVWFGLSSIKGVRKEFVLHILEERRINGHYQSLESFLFRIDQKWLKLDQIQSLIFSGTFDNLEGNRRKMIVEVESIIKNIIYSGGSADLLSIFSLKEEVVQDYTLEEKLEYEDEYLGAYISGHPIDNYGVVSFINNVQDISQLDAGDNATILFYVKEVKVIRTKKGEAMAFLEGGDKSGNLSITLFPQIYRQHLRDLEVNKVYVISGKIEHSTYNEELQMLANSVVPAEEEMDAMTSLVCFIKISEEQPIPQLTSEIKQVLSNYPGKTPVIIYQAATKKTLILDRNLWIQDCVEVRRELELLVGQSNVVFQEK